MEEFTPSIFQESPRSTEKKDKKTKTAKQEAPKVTSLGGLAASEGSIWQREPEKPKPKAEKEAENLQPQKPAPYEHEVEQAEVAAEERLAELTPDESRRVAEEYVVTRVQEIAAEQAETREGTPEAVALESDAAFLQTLQEKLQADPDIAPPEAVEKAADETLEQLSVPPLPLVEQPPEVAMPEDNNVPPPPPRSFMPPLPPPPELAPTPAINNNTISVEDAMYYERRAETRGLLVGGIIGYLIGRRRGRIKTEKRLLPIQRKLEKNVTQLHEVIARKEQQIRVAAAEKASVVRDNEQELRRAERQRQMQKPALTPPAVKPEAVALPSEQLLEQSPEVTPQEMSRAELLVLSDRILIDGNTLRSIYETKQITEPGLRRIVYEYLRGGDTKGALDRELMIKELTYERDPQIRDRLAASQTQAATPAPSMVAQSLSLPLPMTPPVAAEVAVPPLSPAAAPREGGSYTKRADPIEQMIMRTWIVVIVILSIIALVLLVR